MPQVSFVVAVVAVAGMMGPVTAAEKWATIKGQIVWDGEVPKQTPVKVDANKEECAKDKAPLEEDYIVNPKSKGVKNVFVWIRPDGAGREDAFPKDKIHPDLMKPAKPTVEIDQPCCRFIPHVLAARAGQKMIIKNSAPIGHNANWISNNNGNVNPLIPAGKQYDLAAPLKAEWNFIGVRCNLHRWMKAHIMVFDHPYYAITDEDGRFAIQLAPTGKFNLFVRHPANGYLNGTAGSKGTPIVIKDQGLDVGTLRMKENKN